MSRSSQHKRCDLCDLPLAQCVHGLEKRRANAQKKASSSKAKAKVHPKLPSKRLCVECGKRKRYGRYRWCLACGKQAGFRLCTSCGRYFLDQTLTLKGKKVRCPTCRKKRQGSVWIVASAGAPGLGKGA